MSFLPCCVVGYNSRVKPFFSSSFRSFFMLYWFNATRTRGITYSHNQLNVATQSLSCTWACTERLCSGTHWCLHRHFQHLTKPGCCPHMLQSYHHHSSPEEVISILLQWLPSSSTHSYSHEVLWTVSHAAHQVCPPPLPGPLPVCI